MADCKKVELKRVLQLCMVVEDLQTAMERYWNTFGIGPWQVYTLQPPALSDTVIHGQPESYTMRLALAQVGDIQWELIEPLTGPSIYKEFLEQNGEGLHHIACAVEDYDQALAALKEQGMGVLMAGAWNGATYSYMDTGKELGIILELFKIPPEFEMPPPEATYPPSA